MSVGFEGLDLDGALALQWRLVQCLQDEFEGHEQLQAGDFGVTLGLNRPRTTARVERVLARFFEAEAAKLVRGAGTGAIRAGLQVAVRPGDVVLLHESPIYPTTATTLETLGQVAVRADFNVAEEVARVVSENAPQAVVIQHTYQNPDDRYRVSDVVATVHQAADAAGIARPVLLVDDNYAAFKSPRIGVQQGADLSAFSTFKVMGPEGVGCLIGCADLIEQAHEQAYSGGSQVQGPEAMEVLRALVHAPVHLALTRRVVYEVAERWSREGLPGVQVEAINIQGIHLMVRFNDPVAKAVAAEAYRRGALPNPVGAESRYEMAPLFYRPSATYLKAHPGSDDHVIRIIPNRAGPDGVIGLLRACVEVARSRGISA